jgi:hypothetical protein
MKKLVQFRFGEKGIQTVEKLKQELSLSSRAEVIRLALNLLNWSIDCLENGYEITVTKGDGKFERVRIPYLELRNVIKKNSRVDDLKAVSRSKSEKIKEEACV